jgi:isopropylmalate/homocitrate/citramalate synthase
MDHGHNLERLVETTQVVKEISGISLSGHKPVVGENCFSYEAGIPAMFSYRLFKENFPLGVMPYMPEAVGNKFKIAIGKKSGRYNIVWHLSKSGRTATDEQLDEIVQKVKDEAMRKRRTPMDKEVDNILDQVLRGG